MATITVTSVIWDNPQPDSYKIVTVAYRIKTLPVDTNPFIIASSGTFVDIAGVFFAPVVINGLDIANIYTVRVISLCGGFTAYRDFEYLPPAAFSTGFSLGFDA